VLLKPRYLGRADLNAILRGDVSAAPGDTCVDETAGKTGFIAVVYLPNWRDTEPGGWNHFKTVATGTWATCEAAAQKCAEDPCAVDVTREARLARRNATGLSQEHLAAIALAREVEERRQAGPRLLAALRRIGGYSQ